MIGFLSGTLHSKSPNLLIVMVGGVGYAVHAGERLISSLAVNKPCALSIHTHVREDALDLYGFADQKELHLFELLLGVPGIGPRTALSVVDRGVVAVHTAVTQSDVDFFTTIPRLGKKNAQKIIIELKTKLGSVKELDLSEESTGETKQLIDALISMGFAHREALAAIKNLTPKDVTLEQKIRRSLQYLGKT